MTSEAAIFASRLREERGRHGMSQATVAERLSNELGRVVHASAVALIEKGERSVRLDEAIAVARVLDVPLQDLLRPHPVDLVAEIEVLRDDLAVAETERYRLQADLARRDREIAAIKDALEALQAQLDEM
jgi:transcriptional regulator with XRE-family HTH domain